MIKQKDESIRGMGGELQRLNFIYDEFADQQVAISASLESLAALILPLFSKTN